MADKEFAIEAEDKYVEQMPDLEVDPEEAEYFGEESPQEEQEPAAPVVTVTAAEVKTFLKAYYRANGLITKYPELWEREEEWFGEIAVGITPGLNQLCERVPAVGHTIHAVHTAGAWARLVWDNALTWYLVWQRKRDERFEKLAEEEAQQRGQREQNQPATVVATGAGNPAPNQFIVPLPGWVCTRENTVRYRHYTERHS